MDKLSERPESAADYGRLTELAKQSFNEKFWLEEKHCLKDVISEEKKSDGAALSAGTEGWDDVGKGES